MLGQDEVLRRLEESGGGPVCDRATVGDLDLRGRTLEVPLNLMGARVAGVVDLSNATLRRGLVGVGARFEGPLRARRCEISGDVSMSHATLAGPVDMSWTRVRGRMDFWRARFLGDAEFLQLMCSPGEDRRDGSYVHAGELNFSWTWFHGNARFERCHLEGPAYFWRTRFFKACSFDETSFSRDATFMGKVSEVCLSRDELGWEFFTCLEERGFSDLTRRRARSSTAAKWRSSASSTT